MWECKNTLFICWRHRYLTLMMSPVFKWLEIFKNYLLEQIWLLLSTMGLYYKTFYCSNSRIFVISWSVCLWLVFPAKSNVCGWGQEPTLEWSTWMGWHNKHIAYFICRSVCLSLCLFILLSVHPSVCSSSVCSSLYLFVPLLAHLSVFRSICRFVMFICLSLYLYIHLPTHLPISAYLYMWLSQSIWTSANLPVCPAVP